jgi:hypothetical protein
VWILVVVDLVAGTESEDQVENELDPDSISSSPGFLHTVTVINTSEFELIPVAVVVESSSLQFLERTKVK